MKKLSTGFIALLTCVVSAFAQVNFDSKTMAKVNASVFEVIVDKHENPKITYEKPLPLDRQAFTIKNDKYIPIGTAFVLQDGTFWTANHVINFQGRSIYDKYYIRDANQNVYEIGEITKFATNRDFINFTVPSYKKPANAGLSTCNDVELNSAVYSVGNALGEGIIIRNGTYTSSTFEDKDGAWKWLRFTAAASPGNSGGPLLNEKGEVLGIITMKSENENLNYALPVKEALDAPKKGVIDNRYYYTMPIITSQKFYHELKAEIELPKSIKTLTEECSKLIKDKTAETVRDIRKQFGPDQEKGFTYGVNGAAILFNPSDSSFPITMYQKETGDWDFAQPKYTETQLEENGYVRYGNMAGLDFMTIRAPDSISLEQLYSNPKLVAEYCVKANGLHRNVVNEQIRITSLGEPDESRTYTDYWGRTWMVNYYNLDFTDATVFTYSLIMPYGLYVIMKTSETKDAYNVDYLDSEFIADHTKIQVAAKLKFWKQFCSLPEKYENLKSPEIKNMKVSIDGDKIFVTSGKFDVTLEKSKFNFDDDTYVRFMQGFKLLEGKPVTVDRGLSVFTDESKKDYKAVYVGLFNKPLEIASDEIKQSWEQLVDGIEPFNGKPFNDDSNTSLYVRFFEDGVKSPSKAETVYVSSVDVKGQNKNKDAKNFSAYFMKNLKVK